MKRLLWITLVSGFIFGLCSCSDSQQERQRLSKLERARLDSIDRAALKVGVMPTLDCLPVYVAYEDSLFLKQGVDVHLRYYAAQMDCDTALMNGRVEGSITDLIRGARMVRKGTPLTYPIATDTYWQLITNKKARIADLKQLSDKMIAMTRYSATDYLADLAVDSGKPKYDVYRVQINDVNLRLIQAYNIAVDSINSKGVKHYSKLISKYCHVDEKTIGNLPKIKYNHALEPRRRDLEAAARVAKH